MLFRGKENKSEKSAPRYKTHRQGNPAACGWAAGKSLLGPATARTLTAVPQIVIGLVEPVFARGIEDIQVHGIFQRPGFVGHVWRDAQHFAGADDDLLAIAGN